MKKLLALITLSVLSAVLVFGQESEDRKVGTFSGLKVSQGIDVYLKKGDKEAVKVEVSGISVSDVLTEVAGTSLRVHLRDGHYFKNKSVKVYVTYVKLEKISASSGSNVFSEGMINSTWMDVNVSSGASVEISVTAETVKADASSGGNIVLEGKAKSVEAEASSAGDIDAYRLECDGASARASSAGSIKVSVAKDLDAEASSAGSIRYRGNPTRTNTNSSSGGSVKKTS